jgi:hypothetical protein
MLFNINVVYLYKHQYESSFAVNADYFSSNVLHIQEKLVLLHSQIAYGTSPKAGRGKEALTFYFNRK